MLRSLKNISPFREIARTLDFHFAKIEQLLMSMDRAEQALAQIEAAQRAHSAHLEEVGIDHRAVMEALAYTVEQLRRHQADFKEIQSAASIDAAHHETTASALKALNSQFIQLSKATDTLTERVSRLMTMDAEAGHTLVQQIAELRAQLCANVLHLAAADGRIEKMAGEIATLRTLAENSPVHDLAKQMNSLQSALRPPITLPAEQFDLENPDVALLMYLSSYLPDRTALDVGANKGEVSQRLLDVGYEVYAFEPFPQTFAHLTRRLGDHRCFHASELAIGFVDGKMDLHIAADKSGVGKHLDSTDLYHSLVTHSMTDDLEFTGKIRVKVRSLDSLCREGAIPSKPGLIKIDTEGYDLEVIRGMGDCSSEVLMSEFWDTDMAFGRAGSMNRLDELVKELRPRGYEWYIVVYRVDGKPISYYCNLPLSVKTSWGNVIFFKQRAIFQEALQWCSSVLPVTHFSTGRPA